MSNTQEAIKLLKEAITWGKSPPDYGCDDINKAIDLLESEPEPTEFKKSPMMSECWLVHPIDDDDCIQCPQVFECREVRSEIDRLKAENADLKKELRATKLELAIAEDILKNEE